VLKNAELDALEADMEFEIWCHTSHQGGIMPVERHGDAD
jgi:hypothetical protein